jgi:hypothetical protein
MPSAEWIELPLPPNSKPVTNKHGVFIVLSPEQYKTYKLWKAYQRHDGQMWLYFGGRIKRKADEVLPGYQILTLTYNK